MVVADGVAVDVAGQPVNDLLDRAGILPLAEDAAVVREEVGIDVIAREDIPRAGGDRRLLAPVLRLGVELTEDHLAVGGGRRNADLAFRQLAELAVQLVAGLAEHEAAVRTVDVDGLIIIGIDIALVV